MVRYFVSAMFEIIKPLVFITVVDRKHTEEKEKVTSKFKNSPTWWHTLVIPALRRQRIKSSRS